MEESLECSALDEGSVARASNEFGSTSLYKQSHASIVHFSLCRAHLTHSQVDQY